MSGNEIDCSECGYPLDYDEVDIGVGIMTGNYRCNNPDCKDGHKEDACP